MDLGGISAEGKKEQNDFSRHYALLTDHFLPQPSLETLLPAADRNKCRNPQLDKVQTLSPKWDVSINSFTSRLRRL